MAGVGGRSYGWLVFLTAFLFLLTFQYSREYILGSDPFYHIKAAELIWKDGLIGDAPWLPYSRYHQDFPDYRWFFHLFLIPFTFGDLVVGAKFAAVFYGTVFFVLFYRLLRRAGVSNPFIWYVIALVGSGTFIFRMSLTRPHVLSLVFIVAALQFLFEGKHKLLVPLSFFYFWLYPPAAAPLLALSVFYVFASAVTGGGRDMRPAYFVALGLVGGMVLNPYFPGGIVSELRVDYLFLFSGKVDPSIEGAELRPVSSFDFMMMMPLLFMLLFASFLLQILVSKPQRRESITLFLMAAFFLPLSMKSVRFVEYFYPLGMLYAAFSIDHTLKNFDIRGFAAKRGFNWKYMYFAVIFFFLPSLYLKAVNVFAENGINDQYVDFSGCAGWLANNTPKYSVVFNTNWGDFTKLFFYNPRNAYVIGLEPASLYMYNESMFNAWVNVSRGRVDNPSEVMAGQFNASYAVTVLSKNNTALGKIQNDSSLVLEYKDDGCAVYMIKKG